MQVRLAAQRQIFYLPETKAQPATLRTSRPLPVTRPVAAAVAILTRCPLTSSTSIVLCARRTKELANEDDRVNGRREDAAGCGGLHREAWLVSEPPRDTERRMLY